MAAKRHKKSTKFGMCLRELVPPTLLLLSLLLLFVPFCGELMALTCRIISLGALSSNPIRHEPENVRTGHATTCLITAGKAKILVDPSLPMQVLGPRLDERAGLKLDDITHVFLTSFDNDRRRCLGTLPAARWLLAPNEREHADAQLQAESQAFRTSGDRQLIDLIHAQRHALEHIAAAPDELAPGVALFPLPGYTPGSCGLILSQPTATLLVTGDAIATAEHLEQGKVLPGCADVPLAQESFREAVEIADILVLGRDNWATNPLRGIV